MIAPIARAYSDDPDVQLMMRVKNGDHESFSKLYQRQEKRVIAFVRHLERDPNADLDDLVQQVFIQIYRARHRYVPSASFSTWMFTITRNVVLNARRGLGRRREAMTRLRASSQFERIRPWFPIDHDPVQHAVRTETRREVQTAIDMLAQRQQQAIQLVHMHGYCYRDVAEKMEMTEKAVKSLLNRAKCNLREHLEPRYGAGCEMHSSPK